MDDWDLQAVVRGCTGTGTAASVDPFSSCCYPTSSSLLFQEERATTLEDDFLLHFPDLFATQTALHELEELCKPFFPDSYQQQQQQQPQQPHPHHHLQQQLVPSPQRSPSSCSGSAPLLSPGCGVGEVATALPLLQQQPRQPPPPPPRPHSQTPRSKRRKNQQKRVVCQVPADGLSSDMWAWRKYGQKPIKGSPYPRGYYRCSSSKGCPARKQVERSRTDPGSFVITYTAEHNHPLPTHRNSLAGSTRHKFPPSAGGSSASPAPVAAAEQSGSKAAAAAAATTSPSPLSSPPQRGGVKREEGEEEVEEEEEEDLLLVGDMEMLGEDDMLFMNLEDLQDSSGNATAAAAVDGFAEHFGAFPPPWMASSAATAAGGR